MKWNIINNIKCTRELHRKSAKGLLFFRFLFLLKWRKKLNRLQRNDKMKTDKNRSQYYKNKKNKIIEHINDIKRLICLLHIHSNLKSYFLMTFIELIKWTKSMCIFWFLFSFCFVFFFFSFRFDIECKFFVLSKSFSSHYVYFWLTNLS